MFLGPASSQVLLLTGIPSWKLSHQGPWNRHKGNRHKETRGWTQSFLLLYFRPWHLPALSTSQTKPAHGYILRPLYKRDKYVFHCVIFSSSVSSQGKTLY